MSYIMMNREMLNEDFETLHENDFRLLLWLLINANYADKVWRGVEVKRGELITSLDKISEAVNLSFQQVRSSIARLKGNKKIAQKSTNKHTILSVCEYETYTSADAEINKQITNNQQTNNNNIIKNTKDTKEKKEENTIVNKNLLLCDFEKFWNIYDKKVGRSTCEKKWARLTDDERATALEHVPKYVLATPEKRYRKNPETYLNQKSFNDEIIGDGNGNTNGIQTNKRGTGIVTDFRPETLRRQDAELRRAMGLPPVDDGYSEAIGSGTRLSLVQ